MRIAGIGGEKVEEDIRLVLDRQEQRYGAVLENHRVLARRPSVFRGFRAMWDGLEESGLVEPRLIDVVNVRVASLIGCGL